MNKCILLLFLQMLSASAQDTMLARMGKSEIKVAAWLVPEAENEFKVKKGTTVKFTLAIEHKGDEYQLRGAEFIEAYYVMGAKEYQFPVKLEQIPQEKLLENQITKLKNRIASLEKMEDASKADTYVKRFNIKNIETKVKYIEHLTAKIAELEGVKEQAKQFDTDKFILPGARLTFYGSGYLPAKADEKLKSDKKVDEGYEIVQTPVIMLKIYNKEGKRISIPAKANFY